VVVLYTSTTVTEKRGVRSRPEAVVGQLGEKPEDRRVKGREVLSGRGEEGQVKVKEGGA